MEEQKLIFDARGNGDGKVCCSIVGGASDKHLRLYSNSSGKTILRCEDLR